MNRDDKFENKSDNVCMYVKITIHGKTGCSSGKINGTIHSNGSFPEKM